MVLIDSRERKRDWVPVGIDRGWGCALTGEAECATMGIPKNRKEDESMIVTTTPSVEGKRIVEYRGIVFGEVISGVDFMRDFAAGLSNFFGGRSGAYEDELIQARQNAVYEMQQRAAELGCNAVVGVDIDYEVLGTNNGMLMVTASGTAVIVE